MLYLYICLYADLPTITQFRNFITEDLSVITEYGNNFIIMEI